MGGFFDKIGDIAGDVAGKGLKWGTFGLLDKETLKGKDPSVMQPREIRTVSRLSPEQEATLRQLTQMGQQGPSLSPLETTSLAGLEEMAMNLASGGGAATRNMAQETLQGLFSSGPEDFDQFFDAAIRDPLLEDFERDILPKISRQFSQSGFYGSERQDADARAKEDLLKTLGRSRAELGFQSRESNLNRKLQALGLTESVLRSGVDPLLAALKAGGDSRREQINTMLAALGVPAIENIAFGDVIDPGSEGILGDLVGAGAQAGAAAFL